MNESSKRRLDDKTNLASAGKFLNFIMDDDEDEIQLDTTENYEDFEEEPVEPPKIKNIEIKAETKKKLAKKKKKVK